MRRILFVTIFMVLVVALIVFILRFFIGGDEDTWICGKGGWVRHGNPYVSMPKGGCVQR